MFVEFLRGLFPGFCSGELFPRIFLRNYLSEFFPGEFLIGGLLSGGI